MENFESQCDRTCSSCCSRCCAFCKAKRSCWPSNETWLCSGQQMLCRTQKTQTYSECKECATSNYQCFWSTITHFDLAHAALKAQVFWKGTLLYKKTTEATQNNQNSYKKILPNNQKNPSQHSLRSLLESRPVYWVAVAFVVPPAVVVSPVATAGLPVAPHHAVRGVGPAALWCPNAGHPTPGMKRSGFHSGRISWKKIPGFWKIQTNQKYQK